MRVLPDYAWASEEPRAAGVTIGTWAGNLPALPEIPEVTELPDSPTDVSDDLVRVADRRIRVMAAYWHEGWPFALPDAWLRPETLQRLVRVADALPAGFGLAIWDAWRDPRLQAVLHDTVYEDESLAPGFVAYPDPDPAHCPPHATGGTVDLTLTWHGIPLGLGTSFDAFVPEAATRALESAGPDLHRDLRRLLSAAMGSQGFVSHPQEWWHWEFGTRYWAAVTEDAVRFGHARPPGHGGADAVGAPVSHVVGAGPADPVPAGILSRYPGAIPLDQFLAEQSAGLGDRGFNRADALAVTASCRDEMVAELRAGVRRHWDNAFDFSSLSGLPLSGVTGMRAILDHAPQRARRREIVFFALPHIGMLADGTSGKVMRAGRAEPTTACGSLTAATAWAAGVRDDPDAGEGPMERLDPEQSLVRLHLLRHEPRLADLGPLDLVARVADLMDEDLWKLVENVTEAGAVDVALVSGILIHGPDDRDYVQARHTRTRVDGIVDESAGLRGTG